MRTVDLAPSEPLTKMLEDIYRLLSVSPDGTMKLRVTVRQRPMVSFMGKETRCELCVRSQAVHAFVVTYRTALSPRVTKNHLVTAPFLSQHTDGAGRPQYPRRRGQCDCVEREKQLRKCREIYRLYLRRVLSFNYFWGGLDADYMTKEEHLA